MNSTENKAVKIGSTAFFAMVRSSWKFRLFMLQKLPAAYFSGLKLEHADEEKSTVSIPFKWLTQNPFRSTYFASLSMAAEMSTGILAMAHVYKRKPAVSMLVTSVEGKFYKKAVSRTFFTCLQGGEIQQAIMAAISLQQPQSIRALSSGYNSNNELVAEFWITWSFKLKA